ncbi:hypothetical protein ES707_21580 [subsurface metagenome]
MKLDWGSGAISVEQVVDAAFNVDNQRDRYTNQIELFAEILLNVVLDCIGRNLGLFG